MHIHIHTRPPAARPGAQPRRGAPRREEAVPIVIYKININNNSEQRYILHRYYIYIYIYILHRYIYIYIYICIYYIDYIYI